MGCFETQRAINVIEIENEPEAYINITSDEMGKYPSLEKAIDTIGTTIKISHEEHDELVVFFSNTSYFKYLDSYYQLRFVDR